MLHYYIHHTLNLGHDITVQYNIRYLQDIFTTVLILCALVKDIKITTDQVQPTTLDTLFIYKFKPISKKAQL